MIIIIIITIYDHYSHFHIQALSCLHVSFVEAELHFFVLEAAYIPFGNGMPVHLQSHWLEATHVSFLKSGLLGGHAQVAVQDVLQLGLGSAHVFIQGDPQIVHSILLVQFVHCAVPFSIQVRFVHASSPLKHVQSLHPS